MAVTIIDEQKNSNAIGKGNEDTSRIFNLTDIFQLSHSSSWTGSAAEYLGTIRKSLEDSASIIRASMVSLSDTAVAFVSGNNAVVLIREPDIINLQAIANKSLLSIAHDIITVKMPDKHILSVVSVNKTMLNRPEQMASYIMQLFSGKNDVIDQFNVRSFGNRYYVSIDDDITNVRQFFEANSPYPTMVGSFGFVASLCDKNNKSYTNLGQQQMFGVSGYNEFIRDNSTGKFTPLVHITDILSVLPVPKILAMILPIAADIFISRGLWSQQFTSVGAGNVNIGNLINEPETNKPWEAKSDADIRDMFRNFICAPILCIDAKAGGADIPGLYRIARPNDHQSLINDIYSFVGETPSVQTISQNIYEEIIGVFEKTKSKYQDVMDIRDFTYLTAISKTKYSPALEYFLSRNELDPIRRFEYIRNFLGGEVVPTHTSITSVLNGKFLMEIAQKLSGFINVEFRNAREVPIDINRFMDQSFQSGGMSVFGQPANSGLTGAGNWYFYK